MIIFKQKNYTSNCKEIFMLLKAGDADMEILLLLRKVIAHFSSTGTSVYYYLYTKIIIILF